MRRLRWGSSLGVLAVLAVALVMAACTASDSGEENEAQNPYPIVPTDDLTAIGEPLYNTNCASCHGDTTTPPPLEGAPPHTDEGHTWHHPDRLLVDWILDGVPLARVMPKWRGQLTEDEVRAILAYIKTFWSEEHREQQIEGSIQYEDQMRDFGN